MTQLNVGCGPFRAPAPWVNLDVVSNDNTHPDIVVDADDPLAGFDDGSAERIYLGHMLEHMPWPDVPNLLAQVRRVLAPGGHVAVVGPDVLKTIQRYANREESWEQVTVALEEEISYQWMNGATEVWPQARHWWNCHEARVAAVLTAAGFADVTPQPITPEALAGWPVVAYTQHQCAVTATRGD